MKDISFFVFVVLTWPSFLWSQPINDEPCNAIELVLNGPILNTSFDGATVQMEEANLLPPTSRLKSYLTGECEEPESWCDLSGLQNTPQIDSSIWFKFTVPDTGEVELLFQNQNPLPIQIAIYSSTDCGDWESFHLFAALQFLPQGSLYPIPLYCLTPGDQFYVMLDSWVDPYRNLSSQADTIQIGMRSNTFSNPGPTIAAVEITTSPSCVGGQDGFGKVLPVSGARPLDIRWSNGDSTSHFYNASAGDYTITITDYCGLTLSATSTVEELLNSPPPILDPSERHLSHPINCGGAKTNGQINAVIENSFFVPPYRFRWNTGDTTAFVSNLPAGGYTVSITNGCGEDTLVKQYTLGMNAGPDKTCLDEVNEGVYIGIDNRNFGGIGEFFSYHDDFIATTAAPACRSFDDGFIGQNSWWLPFDFNDFNLDPSSFKIREIEVFLRSIPNESVSPGIPVNFSLMIVNTKNLADSNLQFIPLDNLETLVPLLKEYHSFRVPLSVDKGLLSPDDILLLRIEVMAKMEDGHIFEVGVNDQNILQQSYHSSARCGIYQPMPLTNGQVIAKVVYQNDLTSIKYEWEEINNGQASSDPVQFVQNPGTYQVTITDLSCGLSVVDEVFFDPTHYPDCISTQTTNLEEESSFTFRPNPSDGHFELLGEWERYEQLSVELYNLQGQLIEVVACGGDGACRFDLGEWASGIYLAAIVWENGRVVRKIVLE